MQVVFSKTAIKSNDKILEFLSEQWTIKETTSYLNDIEKLVLQLTEGKFEMFQKYDYSIYSALIGKKHIRVYFKKQNDELIIILLFFDKRQDPKKLLSFFDSIR